MITAGSFAWAGPAAGKPQKNTKLGKELSARLSSYVVVYEVDRFMIIASTAYDGRVRSTVIPGLEKALAEFRSLFGVGDADGDGPEGGLWKSEEKCRLVLLKDRKTFRKYVEVFNEEADPGRLNPGFADSVQNAQSFYWIEPFPFAVCCAQGAGFEQANQHLFHLLGHILLTCHEYNYKFMPAWLHEGYGARVAVEHAGGNILYCTQGLNNALFGTGVFKHLTAWARSENWPRYIKQEDKRAKLRSLDSLSRLPISKFEHEDAALAWSFVSFLIEEHPEELKKYLVALKAVPHSDAPQGNWLPDEITTKAFAECFGVTFKEIEPHWAQWVTGESAIGKGHNRGNGGSRGSGRVAFDPADHLVGFAEFENNPRAAEELAPFTRRTGENMTQRDLDKIRKKWAVARKKLLANTEELEARKLPGLDAVIAKLADTPASQPLTDEEVAALVRPATGANAGAREEMRMGARSETRPPSRRCRTAIRYLVERRGCYGAHAMLQGDGGLVGGGSAAAGAGGTETDDDLALLAMAAAVEEELFTELARAGAVVDVDFYPVKMKVLSAAKGELVLSAKKVNGGAVTSTDVEAVVKGGTVEARCPWSCIDAHALLLLGKNGLDRKTEDDRLRYALLMLFSGDEAAFRKEMKFVTRSEIEVGTGAAHGDSAIGDGAAPGGSENPSAVTTARLGELAGDYAAVSGEVAFLKELAADDADMASGSGGRVDALLAAAGESGATGGAGSDDEQGVGLVTALRPRIEGILRRRLWEEYVSGHRPLPALQGYQGLDADGATARFVFEFDEAGEMETFDLQQPSKLSHFERRFGVDPKIEKKPFHVEDGAMIGSGVAFAALAPVFTGDIEASADIRILPLAGKALDERYYFLIGYGLDEAGAFVAANSLTHLDIQTAVQREFQHLSLVETAPDLGEDHRARITLRGTADRISHVFNGKEEHVFQKPGHRTGRVFCWMYGAVDFRIEHLEVAATLDPSHLQSLVSAAVSADILSLEHFDH